MPSGQHNRGSDHMRRCAHPDCNARTLKPPYCSRHRPPVQQKPRKRDHLEEYRARARKKRQRQTLGIPDGWFI